VKRLCIPDFQRNTIFLSLVERYTDGVELFEGLVQGLRFDIQNGKPSFRLGVRQDEGADITMEIAAAAARELNSLKSADPLSRRPRQVSEHG
jgi:hypothetical protein